MTTELMRINQATISTH